MKTGEKEMKKMNKIRKKGKNGKKRGNKKAREKTRGKKGNLERKGHIRKGWLSRREDERVVECPLPLVSPRS